MLVNADLHIHSKYSMGTSPQMTIKNLSTESKKKGIQFLATGDALHPEWMKEIKEAQQSDGVYEMNDLHYVVSTEVEDNRRIHHLLFFPTLAQVGDFREKVKDSTVNMNKDGRANIRMSGQEIAEIAKDLGVLIGPCHAFTPWTSIYSTYQTIADSYKDLTDYVSFVELGLSAETSYADRIGELNRLTFLTNSDAHSPYPLKIAREFNRIDLDTLDFEGLKRALTKTSEKRFKLNVGLPPEEGKYNRTACIKCYTHYDLGESIAYKWKCPECGKRIKKGVRDLINELATYDKPNTPDHRPPYLKMVPLAEIIALALGVKGTTSRKVMGVWEPMIRKYGDEVTILLKTPLDDMKGKFSEDVVNAVLAFREGRVKLIPGGGGQYGRIEFPKEGEPNACLDDHIPKKSGQTKLF